MEDDLVNTPQKGSKLEAYFKLNADPKEKLARKLLYYQIPEYYTWEGQNSKWHISRGKNSDQEPSKYDHPTKIGRMYFVSSTLKELFHLR